MSSAWQAHQAGHVHANQPGTRQFSPSEGLRTHERLAAATSQQRCLVRRLCCAILTAARNRRLLEPLEQGAGGAVGALLALRLVRLPLRRGAHGGRGREATGQGAALQQLLHQLVHAGLIHIHRHHVEVHKVQAAGGGLGGCVGGCGGVMVEGWAGWVGSGVCVWCVCGVVVLRAGDESGERRCQRWLCDGKRGRLPTL